ncbi:protein NETWORKED 4A-like [Cucurbita moschata]|uniref:Protein NETWORKED 4A-like n=1 Tax=Cucurbita moschata TaxID=3662 RepID=A0A6J1HMB2_CUCMO|nr:protein NETWORKED 4A-like [Cucurbita moschata]XP_022964912.1 protein NETWORKED 4A-like [Cucurbita moschata]XP_022964913.1 protein NETWORKED 4A-like [Cucurbita moschata]
MDNSSARSDRKLKRLESRKSHSWWWDSHVSPKNSRWLTDNLEEMDRSIKRMLKLIEEDADSFAKKAEMYYQKRPVLISHVEDFYRMYRSLAERYDHVTGELRKNIPSDLQSQGSGISDLGSEPSSTWPSPDQRLGRRKSGPRAAGFDFFLGSGGSNSDTCQKEGDESSSLTDSEPESDDSSVNNYSGGDQVVNRKMIELEIELRQAKEKLRLKEDNAEGSFPFKGATDENSDDVFARMSVYEEEVRNANEKLRISDVQIMKLKSELQKYRQAELSKDLQAESVCATVEDIQRHENGAINQKPEVEEHDKGLGVDQVINVEGVLEELKITKEKLDNSQKELSKLKLELENNRSPEKILHLQNELEAARKDATTWKAKLSAERREVSKLQERVSRLKASLSDREHEIRDLKLAVSDAELKIFPEKAQVKAEMSKLFEERAVLMEQVREGEHQARVLEDEIRKVKGEKGDLEERLSGEIGRLETTIVGKVECIENLERERDELHAEVVSLKDNLRCKEKQVDEVREHVQKLERERVELVSGVEKADKVAEELRLREKELEREVERQRELVMEGAEEKREAIRQLCFSIEHYRSGYHMLREVFIGHKRVPVLAS